ncbi:SUMF1/EgtB/PvdO family nonheme iron enzyme [bacterium]|nr:SUMF1/EgtB/PvdO family nonheme iron enzyme [bacterium]
MSHAAEPQNTSTFETPLPELLKTFVAEFVAITPGRETFPASFEMGSSDGPASERPRHRVTLSKPFAVARYEVTQNLYAAVMGSNPSQWKGPRNSAEMMTWSDAVAFCGKLTKLLREAGLIQSDEVIRLPTEAEWEYCCRAGTSTRYSFGDEAQQDGDTDTKATRLDEFAWHTGNAAGNDPPVGALKPNAWGLYDLHGYLWEFVEDEWFGDYSGAPADGSARTSDRSAVARHVVRGGSWRERFGRLTSAARMPVTEEFRRDDVGFRCVRAKAD